MDFVDNLVYSDGDDTYTEDEVPQKFRMSTVQIDLTCPVCQKESTAETSSPLSNDYQYTCPHCREQYFLYPAVAVNGKNLSEQSTQEKIEMQLNSVANFHDIADRYPDEATALASAPETAVFGTGAVLLAMFGLGTMAVYSQGLWQHTLLTVGYISVVIAVSLGVAALMLGAAGSIYRGWLIYRSLNPEYGFQDFIVHSGNYYHRNPFIMK